MIGYTNFTGENPRDHIHRLRKLVNSPDGYRWKCVDCMAELKRKSGIVMIEKPPKKETQK